MQSLSEAAHATEIVRAASKLHGAAAEDLTVHGGVAVNGQRQRTARWLSSYRCHGQISNSRVGR